MFKKIGVTTLLFLTLSGQAFAADKALTSTQATSLAQSAVSIGLKQGYNVAVTVVDANGVILATVRADEALPHTPKTSFKKAFTAFAAKENTSDLIATIHKGDPTYMNKFVLSTLNNGQDNIIFLRGGVLIKHNDAIVGAIGVGGAPGGQLDDNIAFEALKDFSL